MTINIKDKAIEVLLQNINNISIRRVGEDLDELASIKDLDCVFDKMKNSHFNNIINKKTTIIEEDSDYFIVVEFKK